MTAAVTIRRATPSVEELYAGLTRADRYIHATRDQALLNLLRRHGIESLSGQRIIEVGCGTGSLIQTLIHHGADADLIEGIDVSAERARATRLGHPRVAQADASALPYADGAFDLALAFTSFSSMPDDETRRAAASEVLRVLRPGGLAVVYDFRLNPMNPQTKPVRERALRGWFSGRQIDVERVTLAPPIVRALGGIDALCRPLESITLLRTHLMAAITK